MVDELAHTNVPGSRNEKRWQDVEELLEAGIDVISTVNIQHLESMNDVVEEITGIEQRETIPDAVVRAADQVELIDQTPEALRRRMAHGNIYAPEKVDAALGNYFRLGNLGALRELALMWVADRVDEALEEYRELHGISGTWETRERVVVAITGAPGGEDVLRRAARMAMRTRGELLGVHVRPADGLAGPSTERLAELRRLLTELGGTYHEVSGGDVAEALVGFARAENASQLVMGASRRSRWSEFLRGSVINGVLRAVGPDRRARDLDRRRGDRTRARRSGRRRGGPTSRVGASRSGGCSRSLGPPLLARPAVASATRGSGCRACCCSSCCSSWWSRQSAGSLPAIVAAVSGSLLANFFFTPPVHTFTIAEGENLLALFVFLVVAVVVSWLVSVASRRTADVDAGAGRGRDARRTRRHAGVDRRSAAAARRAAPGRVRGGRRSRCCASCRRRWLGGRGGRRRAGADPTRGGDVLGADRRRWRCWSSSGARSRTRTSRSCARSRRRCRSRSSGAGSGPTSRPRPELAEGNELRTALLAAVSHDLRTPLASIKASVTSLLQRDVAWTPEATERVPRDDRRGDATGSTRWSGNLLDMSRLQTGAMQLVMRDVGLEEVVPRALDGLPDRPVPVVLDLPETLPRVNADAPLLERAVANIVDNARAWSRAGQSRAGRGGRGARTRSTCGSSTTVPGIPVDRARARSSNRSNGSATTRATGPASASASRSRAGSSTRWAASSTVEDTPGGGVTMVISLPAAHRMSRVLVVDDEPQIRRALGINLRARGYDVDLAETGEEGLELAARHHPDVVVLDLGLPGHRRRRGDPGAAGLEPGAR